MGLRILRSNPKHQGILLIDGKVCALEASFYGDSQDERSCSQDSLLLAVIKSRRNTYLYFW